MHDHDDHSHHDHSHDPITSEAEDSLFAAREVAIRTLLIEKGIFSADELRHRVELMEGRSPALGAKVVARAWIDGAYKARLLADAETAVQELGLETMHTSKIVAVENTDDTHNVIVCTLCSCYPIAILGRPPAWYKSLAYRSRVVANPRPVLEEFGLSLPNDVAVRVHDSTADIRYLVIPQRPEGTENLSEVELAGLVTRDSMIGVALAQSL
ncbi:MAG: nitrile hydratase subunit alpha [Candidatus Latescibacteria bacterium]|jgi:nitrile hydratase subunit alpha|nr:nitrile hydratase subunit alpha [Candidatus Latescibacterota bacterium]